MADDYNTHGMGEADFDGEDRDALTTNSGEAVPNNQNTRTAGPEGPALMDDYHYFEKMAQFNRERIPERVVHAKGGGAYGTFTVTNDEISEYTIADMFSEVGKETPMFARSRRSRDPAGRPTPFATRAGSR